MLIDEFQRVGSLSNNKMKQVCDSLHLIFNSNPLGLRMILTFAISDPQAIPASLTGDLLSRVTDRMSLPPMSREEVHIYLRELLDAHQHKLEGIPSTAPFDAAGIKLLSDFAYDASDGNDDLCTPRKVNMVGETILLNLINRLDEDIDNREAIEFFSGDDVQLAIDECDRDLRARISGDFDDVGG